MISLGGLVSQRAFGKFEMGKVISNPFANAFIKEGEGEDHEVSMANNSLDTIIKMATELKAKMGEDEKQIPAWIQDHIAKAENLISQASGNYHEYGDSNESVNEAIKENDWKTIYNVFVKFLKANTKALEIRVMMRDEDATKKAIKSIISGLTNAQRSLKLESVNEDKGPCWKGYKQVGMKDKGGRQVPNCVPNESVVNEEPAKSTGEKIQNLNNRIKDLKDDMMSTNSTKQKNLIQQKLKNALQTLSNYKKQNISKESVSEGVSSADMDKIKGAVEAAKSFMNVGAELKKLGMKYTFATEPLAIYIIQPTPNNKVAIVNKKYVSKPDFVVGDIAVGVMEGKSVTEASGRVPQIFLKTGAVEKKIKELMADRKKAVVPYNTEKDPAKKESLKQILIKLTKQIQGYEKNLVQLRDKEEEYIQQMQADAELDTSAFD